MQVDFSNLKVNAIIRIKIFFFPVKCYFSQVAQR